MKKIEQIIAEAIPHHLEGEVVDYIPILKDIDKSLFNLTIIDKNEQKYEYGAEQSYFSMQSISKVLSFIVATQYHGLTSILKYVDLEPTGDPFNSIIRLESSERGKPFNPLINAGAITVSALLPGNNVSEKVQSILRFIQHVSGVPCKLNEAVYKSEEAHSYRNRAITYYLKENDFIVGEPDEALEVYLRQCSIEVTTEIVAKIGLLIANDGLDPKSNERFIDFDVVKVVKALMVTCGMYNYSGKYAAFIGIPSKSGVSGGILCSLSIGSIEHLQGPIGIGVFSPSIDEVGNSIVGLKVLAELSKEYDLNIF